MTNGKVCAKCRVEMRLKEGGILVIEMGPMFANHAWHADLWKCPLCGIEVILDFSQHPIASGVHANPEIGRVRSASGTVYRFWRNSKERTLAPLAEGL